jgi:hypothetical protein
MRTAARGLEKKVIVGVWVVAALLIVIVSVVYSQRGADPAGVTEEELRREEHAVYSALINERFAQDKSKSVVICEFTTRRGIDLLRERFRYIYGRISGLSRGTANNFLRKREPVRLSDDFFNVDVKCIVMSKGEEKQVFGDSRAWERFYEKYPASSGLIRMSRVGFNRRMTEALVYAENQSDYLAGSGVFYLITKEDKVWRVSGELPVWIS